MTCPVCNKKYKLPIAAVEGLPNNLGVIHIIKLENEKKAGQLVYSQVNLLLLIVNATLFYSCLQELVFDV